MWDSLKVKKPCQRDVNLVSRSKKLNPNVLRVMLDHLRLHLHANLLLQVSPSNSLPPLHLSQAPHELLPKPTGQTSLQTYIRNNLSKLIHKEIFCLHVHFCVLSKENYLCHWCSSPSSTCNNQYKLVYLLEFVYNWLQHEQ